MPHRHIHVVGKGTTMNRCSTTASVSNPDTKHKLVAAKASCGCTDTAIQSGTSTAVAAVTDTGISQFHDLRVK